MIEGRAWMRNCIALKISGVITYPCHNLSGEWFPSLFCILQWFFLPMRCAVIFFNQSNYTKSCTNFWRLHYSDVIMSTMAYQIPSVSNVHSTVFRCRSKKTSKLHVTLWGKFNGWPVNSLHKGPVIRKIFPLVDVIMRIVIVIMIYNVPPQAKQS